MKPVKYIPAFLAVCLLLIIVSCKDNVKESVLVDLNTDVQFSYTITAMSPDPISFTIRSTSAWEVYSYNPEWCDISPSSGDAGEESTTVTVAYHDSDWTDERKDTLAIKSGDQLKLVTVTQEGTAYLNVDKTDIIVPPTGDEVTVNVTSNQKWTAQVTEGSEWLTITEGRSGEGDGRVVLSIPENTGEIRTGKVILYDRIGDAGAILMVTEDGAVLVPEAFELRAYSDTKTVELAVESNVAWIAECGAGWVDFEDAESEGSGTLKINLETNGAAALRKAVITIKADDPEGKSTVSKEVTLKQAGKQSFTRYVFSEENIGPGKTWEMHPDWQDAMYRPTIDGNGALHCPEAATRLVRYSDRFPHPHLGDYRFRVKTEGETSLLVIFFQFYGTSSVYTEVRCHLDAGAGMTAMGVNDSSVEFQNIPFDKTVAHDVMLRMSEDNGYIHFEWWLDDVEVYELTSSEILLPNATWMPTTPEKVMQIQIGTDYYRTDRTGVFEYYEYAESVDWE